MNSETRYCQDCGSEVSATDGFCSECGAELRTHFDAGAETSIDTATATTAQAGEFNTTADDQGIIEKLKPTSSKTAATGIIFGLIIGFLLAWGLIESGGAGAGFFIGLVAGALYIWNRPSTHHSIASGLYSSGIILVFVPIMIYVPVIAGADSETLEGAGQAIGGTVGLFIWTIVFAIIAGVIGLVGRFIKKRAPEV